MKDLYEILGLTKGVSDEDITKAYRSLARKYHPDRNPGDTEAEEKFKEIASAYETLNDKNKRIEYDRYGSVSSRSRTTADPFRSPFGRGKPFTSNLDDFFTSFFGEQQRVHKPTGDIVTEVAITLDQVLKGGTIKVRYPQKTICLTCAGAGGIENNCTHCNGKGTKVIEGKAMNVKVSCSACEGRGKILSSKCPDCSEGYVNGEDGETNFDIPLGVESGMKFLFNGAGNATQSGRSGDLVIVVKVEEHELFKRNHEGNLILVLPLGYAQMALGGDIDVPTLEGMVTIKIPPGTQSGTKFRLKSRGLPKFKNKPAGSNHVRGDQYVCVELEIPKNISDRHQEILRELIKLDEEESSPQRKEYLEKVKKLWTKTN